MKIPKDKQLKLLEKIIKDTKTSDVYWNRISKDCVAAASAFPNIKLDREGVFSGNFKNKNVKLDLYLAMGIDNMVRCSMGVDIDALEPFNYKDEDIRILLLRLFNLIFDKWPNVNRDIDFYLSLDQTEDID